MSNLLIYAIPGFLAFLGLEMWLLRNRKELRGYELRDTVVSLGLGIGSLITKIPFLGGLYAANLFLYEHRLITMPDAAWVWLLLFVGEDLCYYWFHRTHHEIRVLWSAHVHHHSSTHYNFSTALRQPLFTFITGAIFWAPLPLLGFRPENIVVMQAISLLYQFFLHTEVVGKLGPFEWIFNTPSHHRVHHARNGRYLDRNHGGILIVWDRLFGTFEEEGQEAVDYGLTENINSFQPLVVVFHDYQALVRSLRSAKSLSEALGYIFGPPGWAPGDLTHTSAYRRAQAKAQEAQA